MPTPALTIFRSGSGGFSLNYSTNTNDVVIRTDAVAAGWDTLVRLNVIISSGVTIGASSSLISLDAGSTAYPNGLYIVNDGTVQGKGGAAGAGGSVTSAPAIVVAGAGSVGGTAFRTLTACTLLNNGSIIGGGGGGGGGRGVTAGAAGAAGTAAFATSTNGTIGSAGSSSAAGAGGAGGNSTLGAIFAIGGAGGAGAPAISGIANVTLTNNGTISGTQV